MERLAERGLTLIEVVLAMLLLAIALLALAASFPLAMLAVANGGAQTTATLLAQQALETAKSAPKGSLPSLDTGGFADVAGHAGFQRSIAVAPGAPTATTTTVTVVVRVTGGGAGPGGLHDTTLASVLGE